jgi:radical SAM-linked protein
VTFSKRPGLRFLSHHDVMRTFHRALRRAGLPVRMTEGYNRRPRVVFPHALEVGIASEDELVEVELDAWVAPAEFVRRLGAELPRGLEPTGCRLAAPRRQSSVAIEAHYEARLDGAEAQRADEGARRLMDASSWKVQRVGHKGDVREIDLRAHVVDLAVDRGVVSLRLRLGRPGAAKPREVIAAVLGRELREVLAVPVVKKKTVVAGT